jgi:cobalamin biosynthetic protein CobC
MEVGIAAFSDTSWIKKTRAQLAANRLRLCEMLTHAGFQIQGGTDLFTFAHHDQAVHIFGALCTQHILTRPFEFDPHKLRFGQPANEHEWQRLNAVLKSV